MSKVINITDKLSLSKPKLVIGEDEYDVNNSMETVLKFQELSVESTFNSMEKAITIALGDEGAAKLQVNKMSFENYQVLVIAIMAAMQGLDYEEAEARFRKAATL